MEYFVGTYRILPEKGLIFLRFRVQRTEKIIPTVTIENSSHALYDIELRGIEGKSRDSEVLPHLHERLPCSELSCDLTCAGPGTYQPNDTQRAGDQKREKCVYVGGWVAG